MGVTAFFYAATGSLDQVEAALRSTYRDELSDAIAEDRAQSPGAGALEQFYRSNDDTLVVLWKDGPYTCWAESEAGLAEDAHLIALSAQLGTVLLAMIGDHGGSYAFAVFRDGKVVRWIQNDWELTGSPIPEEAGIDPASFSYRDVEVMWERFGLKPFYDGVPPFRALRSASPSP
jgi:hypothetical protein